MNDYPNPKFFPDERTHLLFDIGYGYALMFRVRGLLIEVEKALPPGQVLLRMEVEEMLETMKDFNKGRLQSVDRVYAVIGESLKLARELEAGNASLPPAT